MMVLKLLDGVVDVDPACVSVKLTKDRVVSDVKEPRIALANLDGKEASLLLNELEDAIESYLPATGVICGTFVVRIDEHNDCTLSVDIVLIFQLPKTHNTEVDAEAEDTVSVKELKVDILVVGNGTDKFKVEAETTNELLDNDSLKVDNDKAVVAVLILVIKVVLVEDTSGLMLDTVSIMVELLGKIEGDSTEVNKRSELRARPDEITVVAFELLPVALDKTEVTVI